MIHAPSHHEAVRERYQTRQKTRQGPSRTAPATKKSNCSCFTITAQTPLCILKWQAYFRAHQPPTLVVWGKNDVIFPADGAHPYKRDLKTIDFHLLDTGHFALEEDGDEIARHIRRFLKANIS